MKQLFIIYDNKNKSTHYSNKQNNEVINSNDSVLDVQSKKQESLFQFEHIDIVKKSSIQNIKPYRSCIPQQENTLQEPEDTEDTQQFREEVSEMEQFFMDKYVKFPLDVELLLTELRPLLQFNQHPPYAIFINTYNLLKTNTLNYIGLGIFHSSVEIAGCIEVAFGGHDFQSTGVYAIKPRSLPNAKFYKSIYVNHCWLSKQQLIDRILMLAIQWHGNSYDIIHHNCNDFTDALLMSIIAQHIPSWINRAANGGKALIKDKGKAIESNLHELVKCQNEREEEQYNFTSMVQ